MLLLISSSIFSIRTSSINDSFLILIITVIVTVFLLLTWFGTYYVIEEDNLIVKCGPIRRNIPLKTITSVKKTNNPISSPALSLQRLEIHYGQYKTIYISPHDRDEFVEILQKKCPNL